METASNATSSPIANRGERREWESIGGATEASIPAETSSVWVVQQSAAAVGDRRRRW